MLVYIYTFEIFAVKKSTGGFQFVYASYWVLTVKVVTHTHAHAHAHAHTHTHSCSI